MDEPKSFKEITPQDIFKDNDETISFKTYKNYLISLANLIKKEFGQENYLEKINKNIEKSMFDRNAFVDLEKIKSLLFNSWHTELNFLLPVIIGGEFMKYSIHWSPVQAYYSLYLSVRALFESSNSDINPNHTKTLSAISEWISKRKLFLYPWSCYCSGLEKLGNLKFECFKEGISEVSMLSVPSEGSFESCFAKFLKTTRERQFKQKRESTKDIKTQEGKRKKKWAVKDKKKVEKRIHNTTLFDCMYRLRIKSNYEDVDAYILSEMSDFDILEFYESLEIILNSTLYILETLILRYLGKDEMDSMIEEFTKKIHKQEFFEKGIFLRKDFLKK